MLALVALPFMGCVKAARELALHSPRQRPDGEADRQAGAGGLDRTLRYARAGTRLAGRWVSRLFLRLRAGDGPDILFLPSSGEALPSASSIREGFRKEGDLLPQPSDWCCIHSFRPHERPRVVQLPAGRGMEFRSDMERLVKAARTTLRSTLLSEDYQQKVSEVMQSYALQEIQAVRRTLAVASRKGNPARAARQGEDLAGAPLGRVPASDRRLIRESVRALKKSCYEEIEALTSRKAIEAVSPVFSDLRRKYRRFPKILVHLEETEEDILANLHLFTLPGGGGLSSAAVSREGERMFSPYGVGILVARTGERGRPVVFVPPDAGQEDLFGRFSPAPRDTGFEGLKAGAMHQSNGGFLVLEASWVLRHFPLWERVKASVCRREICMPSPLPRTGMFTPGACGSERIPYRSKVIITGTPVEHTILSVVDPDLAHPACHPHRSRGTRKRSGTLLDMKARKHFHRSAREEILSLCAFPHEREDGRQEHLQKVLDIIERAKHDSGISLITDLHIRKALVELYPRLTAATEDSPPRREKIRRPAGEWDGHGPRGFMSPINLYSRKVTKYGKQT